MDGDLVRGLRSRGIDVVTAADCGMIRRRDEEHLSLAAVQGRALYSFNVADFHEIHTEWIEIGREHAGIILAQQKRYSTGEQIRLVPMMAARGRPAEENAACCTTSEGIGRAAILGGL